MNPKHNKQADPRCRVCLMQSLREAKKLPLESTNKPHTDPLHTTKTHSSHKHTNKPAQIGKALFSAQTGTNIIAGMLAGFVALLLETSLHSLYHQTMQHSQDHQRSLIDQIFSKLVYGLGVGSSFILFRVFQAMMPTYTAGRMIWPKDMKAAALAGWRDASLRYAALNAIAYMAIETVADWLKDQQNDKGQKDMTAWFSELSKIAATIGIDIALNTRSSVVSIFQALMDSCECHGTPRVFHLFDGAIISLINSIKKMMHPDDKKQITDKTINATVGTAQTAWDLYKDGKRNEGNLERNPLALSNQHLPQKDKVNWDKLTKDDDNSLQQAQQVGLVGAAS